MVRDRRVRTRASAPRSLEYPRPSDTPGHSKFADGLKKRVIGPNMAESHEMSLLLGE